MIVNAISVKLLHVWIICYFTARTSCTQDIANYRARACAVWKHRPLKTNYWNIGIGTAYSCMMLDQDLSPNTLQIFYEAAKHVVTISIETLYHPQYTPSCPTFHKRTTIDFSKYLYFHFNTPSTIPGRSFGNVYSWSSLATYACPCLLLLIILTHCIYTSVLFAGLHNVYRCAKRCLSLLCLITYIYLSLPTMFTMKTCLFTFTCVCPEICLPEYIFLCLPVFTMLVCACICSFLFVLHVYIPVFTQEK